MSLSENARINAELMGPAGDHDHVWEQTVRHALLTGNPHRKCTVGGCRFVTLDLSDDEDEES